jgi:hypothetical protein
VQRANIKYFHHCDQYVSPFVSIFFLIDPSSAHAFVHLSSDGPAAGNITSFLAPMILPTLSWAGTVQITGAGNFRITAASPQNGATVLCSSATTFDGFLPVLNGATINLGGPLQIASGSTLNVSSVGSANISSTSQIVVTGGLVLGNGITMSGSVVSGIGSITLDGCTLLSSVSFPIISACSFFFSNCSSSVLAPDPSFVRSVLQMVRLPAAPLRWWLRWCCRPSMRGPVWCSWPVLAQ